MKNKMRWISMVGWGFIIVGLTKMLLNAIGLPGDSTDPPMYPELQKPVPVAVETNVLKMEEGTWINGHAQKTVVIPLETNAVNIVQSANHIPSPPPKSLVNPKENLWEIESGSNPTNPTYTMTVYGWKYTNLHNPGPYVKPIPSGPTNDFNIPLPTIEWMNDAVYYTTNQIFDEERTLAARNPRSVTLEYVSYSKDVITTNKVSTWFFSNGNQQRELGFRSDGVVVWRNRK